MKIKNEIKLNGLPAFRLEDFLMAMLIGGGDDYPPEPYERFCTCSCYWYGQGGSSSGINAYANFGTGANGIYSLQGCNRYVIFEDGTFHDNGRLL